MVRIETGKTEIFKILAKKSQKSAILESAILGFNCTLKAGLEPSHLVFKLNLEALSTSE